MFSWIFRLLEHDLIIDRLVLGGIDGESVIRNGEGSARADAVLVQDVHPPNVPVLDYNVGLHRLQENRRASVVDDGVIESRIGKSGVAFPSDRAKDGRGVIVQRGVL